MSAQVGTFHQLKPHPLTHSITHPFICHSPPLSTLQEQGWTLELERERIGRKIEEGEENEEGSTSTTPWTPSKSSILFMVSSRIVALISWIFHQMPNLWFWWRIEGFLAGGGSIICRVSFKDLYLAQPLKHPMDYLLIHLFGILQEKVHEQPISWMKKQRVERRWIFKFLTIEALKSLS